MTFEPFTSAELGMIRKQQISGWSLDRIAAHWRRDLEEVELALWLMIGRWANLTRARDFVNRRLAKRAAFRALPSELFAA